jgi:hypothetical protein
MNQYLSDSDAPQVFYQGRWVNRNNFRVFVYNADSQKLANSYKEYSDLIESGLWFSSKEEVSPKQPVSIRSSRKQKHGSDS